MNAKRELGGLGNIKIKLVADKNMKISRDYGVLIEVSPRESARLAQGA